MKELKKYCEMLLPKKAVKAETLADVFSIVAVHSVPGLTTAASDVLTANWKQLEEAGVLKRLATDYTDDFLKIVGAICTRHLAR